MIQKLIIKSFRGIENKTFDFGKVNIFTGDNTCGKSTCLDSLMWVLCGDTLVYGKSEVDNINANDYTKLCDVKIILSDERSLSRIYGNSYNEKKDKYELVNEFYVNDRKVKTQKEYFEEVKDIFNLNYNTNVKNINLLQALIDKDYLGLKLEEKTFRNLISELVGDINEEELLKSKIAYNCLIDDLRKEKNDPIKVKEFYKQKINVLENQITSCLEYNKKNENIEYSDEKYNNLKNKLNYHLQNLNNEKIIELNKNIQEKTNKLYDLKLELGESERQDLINSVSEEEKKLSEKINLLKKEINILANKGNEKISTKNTLTSTIDSLKTLIKNQEVNIKKIKESKFEEIVCPNCNAIVNEKDLEQFNKNKASKLKEENSILKIKQNELLEVQKQFDENLKELNNCKEQYTKKNQEFNNAKIELENFSKQDMVNIQSNKTKSILGQCNALENELQELKESFDSESVKFYAERNEKTQELQSQLSQLDVARDTYNIVKNNLAMVESYRIEKCDYENRLTQLLLFQKDLINKVQENTNKIFGNDFEFKMIRENKDGSGNYTNCCYASLDGVKQLGINDGNKFLVGITLIEKIKSFIGGCDLPLIFMNSNLLGNKVWGEILKQTNAQIFTEEVIKGQNELKITIKGEK